MYETHPFYFELRVDAYFIDNGQFMSGSFEEDFPCNWQKNSFCVGKWLLASFNEMTEPQPFKCL